MRLRHDTDALTVAQLRADPMLARALDLALDEAFRAGVNTDVPRCGAALLPDLVDWVHCKYRKASSGDRSNLEYCAALYRLLALLGGNVTDLWVGGEQAAVERTVRESLAPLLAQTPGDGSAAPCASGGVA